MNLKRTNHTNENFQSLIKLLDKDLRGRYPEDQDEYDQYNKVDQIDHVLVAYVDDQLAGCGCFKTYDDEAVEIKRMFVRPEFRGRGISKAILSELETWAKEVGFSKAVLETGTAQEEALGLYQKQGYQRIPNYGQYVNMPNSVCFQKLLDS